MAKSDRPARCRRKFLRFFPKGFADPTYLEWERTYKAEAHARWDEALNANTFQAALLDGAYERIATTAVRIESRTNLLFSFEKMALRDAVRSPAGARMFAEGLYAYLHRPGDPEARWVEWCRVIAQLPRRQTRVLTWPVLTVFPFIAQPDQHIFLKPMVMRAAAKAYGFPFAYRSRPEWSTYKSLLDFGAAVSANVRDLKPRDLIDIQSFLWVQGSDEYA